MASRHPLSLINIALSGRGEQDVTASLQSASSWQPFLSRGQEQPYHSFTLPFIVYPVRLLCRYRDLCCSSLDILIDQPFRPLLFSLFLFTYLFIYFFFFFRLYLEISLGGTWYYFVNFYSTTENKVIISYYLPVG